MRINVGRPKKIITETSKASKKNKTEDTSKALSAIFEIENTFTDTASAFKPKKTKVNVISTGSPALDDITMVGGWPRGRVVHLFGPFGGGKTFISMIAAKNALESDPENFVIWFDAENTFEYKWAHNLGIWDPALYDEETGVDTNRLRVIPVNHGISIFERLSGKIKEKKLGKIKQVYKAVPGYVDLIIEGKMKCPLIVLDSLAAIVPPGEDTSAVGKVNIALLSRFLPIEFRRLATPLYKSGACLMCINQVTTNIGDSWGDEFGFSGGEKLKHWISLNLFVDKVGKKETKILTVKDQAETVIGQTVKFIVKKNKFGPYPRSCQSRVLTVAGTEHTGKVYNQIGFVDTEEEWTELAVTYGVIHKGGAWFEFDGEKFQGKEKFASFLRDNPDQLEKIKEDIKAAKLLGAINDMHVDDEGEVLEQFNKTDDEEEEDNAEEMEE